MVVSQFEIQRAASTLEVAVAISLLYAWCTIHADSGFMRGTWVKIGGGSFTMQVPASVKPAIWGAIGGAVAAMIIGFSWGGWVTGGTAGKMATTSAQDATVLALTPLCVAKAEQQPDQIVLLQKESSYRRGDFVDKAGWVANVNEKYRSAVASACGTTLVEALD